jgi:hypothetical protein
MARVLEVIWGKREAEYFCRQDWTAQITLIEFNKIVFMRKPMPTALRNVRFREQSRKHPLALSFSAFVDPKRTLTCLVINICFETSSAQ